MRLLVSSLALVLVTGLKSAHADVTYAYQGRQFTEHTGIYKATDSLSGTFTLSAPVEADQDAKSYTPLSFSFTSGEDTIDTPNPVFDRFLFSTDGNGTILSYSIELVSGNVSYLITGGSSEFGTEQTALSPRSIGDVFGNGTLTVSSVTPEPNGLLLLGAVAIGILEAARRKRLLRLSKRSSQS